MQIRDAVESLHDFWTILQTAKCLDKANMEYFKNTRESKTSQPCLRTLI